MAASAAPEPPKIPTSPNKGASRSIDPERLARNAAMAANPEWENYKDSAGYGAVPSDILGAADILSEKVDPRLFFNQMMAFGPGRIMDVDDGRGGTYQITVGDYFSGEAAGHLESEGFYSGLGYTYKFDPKRGGMDADSAHPTTLAYISSVGNWPADITLAPTATTNPSRPRTVAAGYDGLRRVLTVIFRDGTFYNYYGVSPFEWQNFATAKSKGEFIYNHLDGKVRGKAEMSAIPQAHQEILYKVARTIQVIRGGYQPGHTKKPKKTRYGKQNTAARQGRRARAKAESTFSGAAGMSRYTGGP